MIYLQYVDLLGFLAQNKELVITSRWPKQQRKGAYLVDLPN